MNDTTARAVRLSLQLFSEWLAERTGHDVTLQPGATPASGLESSAFIAAGTIDGRPLAAALVFIAPVDGDDPWYRAKAALEARLGSHMADSGPGGFLIWIPRGVDLPEREPGSSEVVLTAEQALRSFVPGGHGDLRFAINLYLRKSEEEGSYLTARGGLANHWARFTNRVFGHYQLDSLELHRLPEGEGHLDELVDQIVRAANDLGLGLTAVLPYHDTWSAQRLRGGDGVAFIGEPPDSERSAGAGLRRGLRQAIQAVRGPLLEAAAEVRVVFLVGPYTSLDDQPVGTALLGFDPALHRGIDLVALAADARVKPLLDLTRNPVLAVRPPSGV